MNASLLSAPEFRRNWIPAATADSRRREDAARSAKWLGSLAEALFWCFVPGLLGVAALALLMALRS